jgi:hypothetical protein
MRKSIVSYYILYTGETEEGWNNSYISVKKSPIPMIFTIEHSQFNAKTKDKKTKLIKIN